MNKRLFLKAAAIGIGGAAAILSAITGLTAVIVLLHMPSWVYFLVICFIMLSGGLGNLAYEHLKRKQASPRPPEPAGFVKAEIIKTQWVQE